MSQFNAICKQSFRNGLIKLYKGMEYTCEKDEISQYGDYFYVYVYGSGIDYVYLSYMEFDTYFDTIKYLRKEKLNKINESNID